METVPNDLLQFATAMGVGGILAYGMFMVYRKDMRGQLDNWRGQSEILFKVVSDNTQALTELRVTLERTRFCPYDERKPVDRGPLG